MSLFSLPLLHVSVAFVPFEAVWYRYYTATPPGLYYTHYNDESQYGHPQLSSAAPCDAVRCRALPCGALRCCVALRCAFVRTHTAVPGMMRTIRHLYVRVVYSSFLLSSVDCPLSAHMFFPPSKVCTRTANQNVTSPTSTKHSSAQHSTTG